MECDRTNKHVIELIKYYLMLNPDMVFFIENPRGMLRKQPWMIELEKSIPNFKRHTVCNAVRSTDLLIRGQMLCITTSNLPSGEKGR